MFEKQVFRFNNTVVSCGNINISSWNLYNKLCSIYFNLCFLTNSETVQTELQSNSKRKYEIFSNCFFLNCPLQKGTRLSENKTKQNKKE